MSGQDRRLRLLASPPQGWWSLLLLLGMLLVVALSVSDARPLWLHEAAQPVTDALLPLTLLGALVGYLLARGPLGVVSSHVIGAVVAAGLLLMVAGAALLEGSSPLPASLADVSERVSAVWLRLDADIGRYVATPTTTPTLATFLLLGAICWTTAQFGAFSVFRYDRAGPAVMAAGALLFLNVALGSLDRDDELLPVVPVLAAFSAFAMLLLVRLQLGQQRLQWARRHIADSGEVSRLFLRSGTLFVALTVASASSLTAWATIEAADVSLADLGEPVEDMGQQISRWLGLFGVRPPDETPTTIDDRWTIADRWQQPPGVAFRVRVEGQLRRNYWWGWAHDSFDGRAWDRQRLDALRVPAGEPLPVEPLASAGGDLLASATITIEDEGLVQGMAFRLAEAGVIDRDVDAVRVDDGGGIGDIEFRDPLEPGEQVTVDSWVRDYSDDSGSLTANQLREAGTDYPAWVTERYLQGTQVDISGARARRLAGTIASDADFATPYDQALEVQRRLRGMRYTPDMQGVCREGEPIPECVLRTERGFCQHYATTMAMVLRAMGIPTRIVTGYLPGERIEEEWVVEQAAFHNWVEAFFPDHGWVRFDPTPRDEFGLTPTDLPEGPAPTAEPDLDALPPEPTETTEPQIPEETPPAGAAVAGGEDGSGGGLSVLLLGLLLGLAGLAVAAGLWLVRFRRLADGDGGLAYRGVVSLATRLGHGPHPSQTEYEFAGSLSRTLPAVREDLYLVAGARVETAYGRRQLEAGRRGALRRAYARIRTALLRLWLGLRR